MPVETRMVPTGAVHEGFLVYQGFRYLKLASLLCVLAIVAYWWHQPASGPGGGTWLGYTLGTVGALLIVWLTWLGRRKRNYASNLGTVRGWLSAHVYLGLSLVTIVTLHTGFHFGWNVHTLSYVLMLLVIASGVYGIIVYARYPSLITANRDHGTRDAWLAELDELNEQSLKLADTLDAQVHQVIVRSIDRIRIGGNLRAQLFGPREPLRKGIRRGWNRSWVKPPASWPARCGPGAPRRRSRRTPPPPSCSWPGSWPAAPRTTKTRRSCST